MTTPIKSCISSTSGTHNTCSPPGQGNTDEESASIDAGKEICEDDCRQDEEEKLKSFSKSSNTKLSDFSIESIISRKRPSTPDQTMGRSLNNEDDSIPSCKQSRLTPPISSYANNISTALCRLDSHDLWRKFDELGTEMIITKSGRRMFPLLRLSFSKLDPSQHYLLAMDIMPVDNRRYRYAYHRSSWLVAAGRTDSSISTENQEDQQAHLTANNAPSASGLVLHPDGPFTGEQLMRNSVSFEKVKLTNNTTRKKGYIILDSMHKYEPRIHLIQISQNDIHHIKQLETNCSSKLQSQDSYLRGLLNRCPSEHKRIFTFSATNFIAVTAYQNQLITKLKIDCNPFAKGFRDSSRLINLDLLESSMRIPRDNQCNFESTSPIGLSYNQSKLNHSTLLMQQLIPSLPSLHSCDNPTMFNFKAGFPSFPSAKNVTQSNMLNSSFIKMNMRMSPTMLPSTTWPLLSTLNWHAITAASLLHDTSLTHKNISLINEERADSSP